MLRIMFLSLIVLILGADKKNEDVILDLKDITPKGTRVVDHIFPPRGNFPASAIWQKYVDKTLTLTAFLPHTMNATVNKDGKYEYHFVISNNVDYGEAGIKKKKVAYVDIVFRENMKNLREKEAWMKDYTIKGKCTFITGGNGNLVMMRIDDAVLVQTTKE